jgi:hypothetical protein
MRGSPKTRILWFWIRAVGCTALVTLLCLQSASSQTKPVDQTAGILPCAPPKTEFEAWNRLRSLPVKVTDISGQTVYWKFEDKTGVHLGSFYIQAHSNYFDEKLNKKDRLFFEYSAKKSKFGINYDSECFSIISATQMKSQP